MTKLWLRESGFGCSPTASGRAVYATCLGDGEKTRWNREDFTAYWTGSTCLMAMEKLAELRGSRRNRTPASP